MKLFNFFGLALIFKFLFGGSLGKTLGGFAIFGCFVKLLGVLFLFMFAVIFLMSGIGGGDRPPPAPAQPPVGDWSAEQRRSARNLMPTFSLSQYPLLDQLDTDLYDPPGLAEAIDPEFDVPVKWIACLATVYVMLERGRGDSTAKLQRSSFDANYYAVAPTYAGAPETYNVSIVLNEIAHGRPVILEGKGGPLGSHFMLAVGRSASADSRVKIFANDPLGGKLVELDGRHDRPRHPTLSDLTFTHIRRVANE